MHPNEAADLSPEQVEALASDQILNRGVRMLMRAPFLLRLFGKKTIAITVRAPYLGTMIRVSKLYLSTGISGTELEKVTHEEALSMMSVHGVAISKAVACAWLNGYWRGLLFTGLLARYIRNHCKARELLVITSMILVYGGVSDFINTTRSLREMRVTAPRIEGHKTQGS